MPSIVNERYLDKSKICHMSNIKKNDVGCHFQKKKHINSKKTTILIALI